jgi:ABC-2 type transport system permease protein
MLANVFTKTARDRWKSTVIAAVSLGCLLVFGMAAYNDVDVAFWDDFPEAFRTMFAIPEGADVGGLAYGAIYTGYGALTMAAVALAAGASVFAGEERKGTIGLLLGNPVSRTRTLMSQAGAIVSLCFAGSVILWVAGVGAPQMLNVDVGDMHITELVVMMFVIALFHGFLALAIAGWTGKPSLASGVATGVLVASFVGVGLFPIITGWENVAKVFPWYYFSSSQPALNGVDWGHFAVLAGSILALGALAVVGVNRRDLKSQSVGTKLIDRLRENPLTHRMAEMIAGTARVSRIWVKTASDHQALLFIVVVTIVFMSLWLGPMYNMLDDAMASLAEQFPERLLALFGGGDLSTAEGFFQIELFSLVIPIGLLAATISIGARAMAGEEERNTMGLLLASPIRRSTVVLQKTWTMVLFTVIIGIASFLGIAGGSVLGGLGMNMGNIAAACLMASLLGLLFGGLALALSGATGRTAIAVYGSVGIAVITFIANGFLTVNENTEAWARISPFYYLLATEPLVNGMDWLHGAGFLALFAVLFALAVFSFNRRDLRQTG